MATVGAAFQLTGKAAIVVGVGYPTDDASELMRLRTRDLTPPRPLERIPQRPGLPSVALADDGGAEDFYASCRRSYCRQLRGLIRPIQQRDLPELFHVWPRRRRASRHLQDDRCHAKGRNENGPYHSLGDLRLNNTFGEGGTVEGNGRYHGPGCAVAAPISRNQLELRAGPKQWNCIIRRSPRPGGRSSRRRK
jgi:hypothetical protein